MFEESRVGVKVDTRGMSEDEIFVGKNGAGRNWKG